MDPALDDILNEVWHEVIGEINASLDWLRQVIFGEFEDNRSTSAVIADMVASLQPGIVLVTSARDLTAVIIRLVKHPEKRADVTEWILVVGNTIPLILPVLAAAAGAVASGGGAVIGGIGGTAVGAILRTVCVLLAKEGGRVLAEIISHLRPLIKGNILQVLRAIQFAPYSRAVVTYIRKFTAQSIEWIQRCKAALARWPLCEPVQRMLTKLDDLERAFYDFQRSALQQIPRTLATLDARLQKALASPMASERHLATTSIPAGQAPTIVPARTRVPAMPENPLGVPPGTTRPKELPPPVEPQPNLHPEKPLRPLQNERLDELARQGHGPQRHEGQITKQQLEDRCERGIDPMTGSTVDGTHGGIHAYGRHATKVNTPEDYVKAHDHLKNSDEFKNQVKAADAVGENRLKVDAKLEDIYGLDYKTRVAGQSRIGSKNNPQGSQPTDFTDGTMKAVYEKNGKGEWELLTMYPEPKP